MVILQTNLLNGFHPSTIICPVTTNVQLEADILRVHITKGMAGMSADSDVLVDQIRAIDNKRLRRKIGDLPDIVIKKIQQNIALILDL